MEALGSRQGERHVQNGSCVAWNVLAPNLVLGVLVLDLWRCCSMDVEVIRCRSCC